MKFIKEFRCSLKMVETEEIFDLIIFRPLGYIVAKLFYYTPATPNFLTGISLILGIAGGILYCFPGWNFLLFGTLAVLVSNIFDCADGQLARIKKNGTKFGRVFDGTIDYGTYTAIYLGIAVHLSTTPQSKYFLPFHFESWFWWVLLILTGFFTAIQSLLVDSSRNDFATYTSGSNKDFIEKELAKFQSEYDEIKIKKGFIRHKFLYKIYLSYLKVQLKTASSSVEGVNAKIYYKKNKLLMRLWTFAGSTSHLVFLMICALFDRFDIYVWSILVIFNAYTIILWVIQKLVNLKRKKCKE